MQDRYFRFLNGHSPDNGRVKLALADVQKSGLSPDTLDKAEIKLFNDNPETLKKHLGFTSINGNPILSVAILMEIPYFDADGNILKYEYRLYPEKDDKKYLHPLHSSPVPYITSDVWAIKDKVHKPIWVTEGVKKVLKLAQHGQYCIGLSGVWGFHAGKNEEGATLLCKEFESFAWRGRTVYLAFDNDLWTNPQVRKALFELALHLIARGALVYICMWKGAKGIDDYLASKTDPAKEISEIKDKVKSIASFVIPEHRDDVLYALSRTIGTMDDLTREGVVTAIAKKLNIRSRSLYRELSKKTIEQDPGFTEEEKGKALRLLKSPTLIKLFLDVCHTRYVGRDKTLLLVKLATMTRHLSRGLSVVLLGTSSVGKSVLIEAVLMTCDPAYVENFSRTSAQYLLYRKEPLNNKVITFYEFNGADSSAAIIRTALTEGELHLGTVQKDASGSQCATEIKKETQGLVILSTYTGSRIDTELSTRVLLQEITHDEALAREVYRQKASGKQDNIDAFKIWQCADSLIEQKEVVIPYHSRLADVFPTCEERFHRDYDKTVMLIKASALLHQYQREHTDDGAVIANEDDYTLVYSLGDAFAQSLLPVSVPVLKLLETAKGMGNPTRQELQNKLGVSPATMLRYLNQAKASSMIETEGKGKTQTITVVDAPEVFTVLPYPDKIFGDERINESDRINGPDSSQSTDNSYATNNKSTNHDEDSEFFVPEEESTTIPRYEGDPF